MEPARRPTSPLTRSSTVVVVGAGLAAAGTCSALRRHGFLGRLVVIGAEGVPPYDRPPLSKELFSRTEPVWLDAELGLDISSLADTVVLDDPVVRLDTSAPSPQVLTSRGLLISADVVVLACGAEPLRPQAWQGVRTLHTAEDAAALRARLQPAARLVSIGAGWIGAELAGAAAGRGVEVTVVEATSTPLSRQLGEVVGAHLKRWYEEAGVTLLTGATVVAADASGVEVVRSGAGAEVPSGPVRLPADVVLAAVGARPATGWLAQTPTLRRDARGAVVVDEHGEVPVPEGEVPRVYAVGDCATRSDALWQQVPGGHWSAALLDPDTVARHMLGLSTPTTPAPYVFSQQLGHDLALFGCPDPLVDKPVFRGDPSTDGGWGVLYVRTRESGSERVTGILVVDSPRDVAAARRLMAGGPVRLDLGRAADPATPLKLVAVRV